MLSQTNQEIVIEA